MLKKLIYNDELRIKLGNNARNRILENFTTEKFKENVKELFNIL